MTSLLDLAPASVKVRGVDVHGISLAGVAVLLARFPELRALFTGGSLDLSTEQIIARVPDAVAAIIAAGTGNPGDAKHEDAARLLNIETQVDFLEAIFKATVPNGFGPFVERLQAMAGKVTAAVPSAASATAPATTSQPRSTKSYKRGVTRRI